MDVEEGFAMLQSNLVRACARGSLSIVYCIADTPRRIEDCVRGEGEGGGSESLTRTALWLRLYTTKDTRELNAHSIIRQQTNKYLAPVTVTTKGGVLKTWSHGRHRP